MISLRPESAAECWDILGLIGLEVPELAASFRKVICPEEFLYLLALEFDYGVVLAARLVSVKVLADFLKGSWLVTIKRENSEMTEIGLKRTEGYENGLLTDLSMIAEES